MTVYPLYYERAHLWPLLSPLESYREEMVGWSELIGKHFKKSEPLEVLDLGTGGGHHLYHLCDLWPGGLTGTAIDLSEPMLQRVAELLPSMACVQDDMIAVRLGRRFPLVLVHDAFAYITDEVLLEALTQTVATHLEPDGIALVKLEALSGQFAGPYRYLTTYEDGGREVTLTHYEWDPDPQDTWLEVIYQFLERVGPTVKSWEERHRLGIFSWPCLEQAWQRVGLMPVLVKGERWDEDRPNLSILLRPDRARQSQVRSEGSFEHCR